VTPTLGEWLAACAVSGRPTLPRDEVYDWLDFAGLNPGTVVPEEVLRARPLLFLPAWEDE
jgi:hypothetical protein